MVVDLFIFISACLLEMMLTFFLLILLGFPSVGTIVNSSHGLNISSRKIEATIPPDESKFDLKTRSVLDGRRLDLELTGV